MYRNIISWYKENCSLGQGTIVIIIINIILFIALNVMPNLDELLLLNPNVSMTIERPWTLVSAYFSHRMFFHIIINMTMLVIFGIKLEKILDSRCVVAIYLLSGFIGSLVIIPVSIYIGAQAPIAGASAAVFGIVTTYAVLRPDFSIMKSKAKWWALALFIFNVITLVTSPQLSDGSAAHISGIMMGLALGSWLKKNKMKELDVMHSTLFVKIITKIDTHVRRILGTLSKNDFIDHKSVRDVNSALSQHLAIIVSMPRVDK